MHLGIALGILQLKPNIHHVFSKPQSTERLSPALYIFVLD